MLKVGVFGAGHLGKFHINNWKEIEGVKLVGFFDPNNDIAKAVTEEYGLKRYLDEECRSDFGWLFIDDVCCIGKTSKRNDQ